ncbi:rhomboid family intramembrane serine protease [Latilactobacillus sakei]|uniref:rhomboid family intramembrane serine protease n=1 Tax=Latilactobacillus sakei TaxID=1599 RepID=UPI003F53524A
MKVNHNKDWREIPFVAYALIIMNVLYFGLMFVAPMIWAQGITSVQGLLAGGVVPFLMASINHISFLSLLMDCVILYFVGSQLESLIGHWRLLAIYILSSLASLITQGLFLGTGSQTITAGLAVLGIFGGFLMLGDAFKDNPVFGQIARQYWLFLFLTAGLQFVVNRNAMYGMVGGILGGFLSSMALGAPRIGKINPLNRVVSGLIYVITLILFVYLGMNR